MFMTPSSPFQRQSDQLSARRHLRRHAQTQDPVSEEEQTVRYLGAGIWRGVRPTHHPRSQW